MNGDEIFVMFTNIIEELCKVIFTTKKKGTASGIWRGLKLMNCAKPIDTDCNSPFLARFVTTCHCTQSCIVFWATCVMNKNTPMYDQVWAVKNNHVLYFCSK